MSQHWVRITFIIYVPLQQRREFEEEKAELEEERAQAIANAVRSLEQDLVRMQTEHAEVIADLEDKQRATISEVKKKQWVSLINFALVLNVSMHISIINLDHLLSVFSATTVN